MEPFPFELGVLRDPRLSILPVLAIHFGVAASGGWFRVVLRGTVILKCAPV